MSDPRWTSSSSSHGRSSPTRSGPEICSRLESRRIRIEDPSRSWWSTERPGRVPSTLHRRDRASLHLGTGLGDLHHLRGQPT